MRPLSLAIGLLFAAALSSACSAQIFDDPFAEYFQRGVTISPGAGNAADANAAIQTIDPWPPYVGYTYIPGNGRAAVGAVEQMYRRSNPRRGISPATAAALGGAGAAGALGTTGGAAPQQSISSGD